MKSHWGQLRLHSLHVSDSNYLEALGLILRRSESFWELITAAVQAEHEYGELKNHLCVDCSQRRGITVTDISWHLS